MKKTFCILLFLLFLPCLCSAQSIFIDYYVETPIDQSIFWVMEDPNGVKYRGGCDIALGLDPNAYVQDHMAEWLADIYEMNADPNTPDWTDSHMGKYLIGLDLINNASSLADVKLIMRKMLKGVYPVVGLPD